MVETHLRPRARSGCFALAIVAAAIGCSAADSTGQGHPRSDGGAGGAGGEGGGTLFDAGGGPDDAGGVPLCADSATQFIYTLTAANELYKFDPPTLAFTLVGTLSCAGGFASPYSMAVDRTGRAWSVFTDGSLYEIDTSNATSRPPGRRPT